MKSGPPAAQASSGDLGTQPAFGYCPRGSEGTFKFEKLWSKSFLKHQMKKNLSFSLGFSCERILTRYPWEHQNSFVLRFVPWSLALWSPQQRSGLKESEVKQVNCVSPGPGETWWLFSVCCFGHLWDHLGAWLTSQLPLPACTSFLCCQVHRGRPCSLHSGEAQRHQYLHGSCWPKSKLCCRGFRIIFLLPLHLLHLH